MIRPNSLSLSHFPFISLPLLCSVLPFNRIPPPLLSFHLSSSLPSFPFPVCSLVSSLVSVCVASSACFKNDPSSPSFLCPCLLSFSPITSSPLVFFSFHLARSLFPLSPFGLISSLHSSCVVFIHLASSPLTSSTSFHLLSSCCFSSPPLLFLASPSLFSSAALF